MERTSIPTAYKAAPGHLRSLFLAFVVTLSALWPGAAGDAARPLASVDYAARVVFDASPAVSGDIIRLGEIARVDSDDPELKRRLEALEVGRAALPGAVRYIQVGTVRLRMRQARLPEREILIEAEGDAIGVRTKHQTLDADRLKETVESWYAARSALPEGATLRLKVDVGEEVAPVGELSIDVVMHAPRWGSAAVPLEIRLDDRPYKRINASVEAMVEQPVWVTTRPFNRGEAVGEGDVELVTRLFAQPVSGPADWTGPVRTTRFVREGTVLTWDIVEPMPDVLKGDTVLIVARKGDVFVQVTGEALSDGWVGQPLAVRNLGSGNVVQGALTDEGTVEVQVW